MVAQLARGTQGTRSGDGVIARPVFAAAVELQQTVIVTAGQRAGVDFTFSGNDFSAKREARWTATRSAHACRECALNGSRMLLFVGVGHEREQSLPGGGVERAAVLAALERLGDTRRGGRARGHTASRAGRETDRPAAKRAVHVAP